MRGNLKNDKWSVQKEQRAPLIRNNQFNLVEETAGSGMVDLEIARIQSPYVEELTTELADILSMDDLEAKIYLNLLRTGPITASALAKEINIDRAKTYRVIDKLASNGIVSISFSSPKLCIAAEPGEVLSLALQKKEEEIAKIRTDGKKIIDKIKEISSTENKTAIPTFRIIQGIENITSQIERILESTRDVFYLVTSIEDVSKLYHTSIPEKIKQTQKSRGMVRLIVDDASPKMIPFIKRFGADEVRIGKLPSKGRIVVSKNCPVTGKLLMADSAVKGMLHENIDSECALFTNSEEMTNNIFTLCNFIWKGATTVNL
jgi:HTH-type transcriptional regulator, sugar sensing transcriptional regulator